MSFICPYCSFENLDPSTFCVHCGKKLLPGTIENAPAAPSSPYVSPPDAQDQDKTLSSSNQRLYATPSPTPSTPYWGTGTPPPGAETPSGVSGWGPGTPSPVTPTPVASATPSGQQWGTPHPPYPGVPMQQQGQQWGAPLPANPPSSLSHVGGTALATIRTAFAGYGTLITHHSWLLDGKKEPGETLTSTVKEKLKQLHYAGIPARAEKLIESQPAQVEREFLVTRRGCATEFIYVAPVDDALYLSRATVVQPSLSYVRVGVLGLLCLIVLLGPSITQGILRSMLNGAQSGLPGADITALLSLLQQATFYALGFSLLYSTALFFFVCLLLLSVISWLRDKDVLMYLRTNRLSDFQMDDVAILEQATDRVVRTAVDQAGLDAIHIVPPTEGYHPKRKIRFI